MVSVWPRECRPKVPPLLKPSPSVESVLRLPLLSSILPRQQHPQSQPRPLQPLLRPLRPPSLRHQPPLLSLRRPPPLRGHLPPSLTLPWSSREVWSTASNRRAALSGAQSCMLCTVERIPDIRCCPGVSEMTSAKWLRIFTSLHTSPES